jgi:hypothetical protein
LSARAAAQLDLLGFSDVAHYPGGEVDWMVRGLPMEPTTRFTERARALRYFINNLMPAIRATWIGLTQRETVGATARDDIAHLAPEDTVPASSGVAPYAVVLNRKGVLLGAIEKPDPAPRALEAMDPAPQTIRPDMTPALAAALMGSDRYLLVTNADGTYVGRYPRPRDRRSGALDHSVA